MFSTTGGEIAATAITPIDSRTTIQAENRNATVGTVKYTGSVGSLNNGDYLRFNNVRFFGNQFSVQARLAVNKADAGQRIEFRLDSPTGALIGTLVTEGAGTTNVFRMQYASVKPITGTRNLFVVFKTSAGAQVGRLDWFRFSTRRIVNFLPLGDSVTESKALHDSYRRYLWKYLEKGGYSMNFIGTRSGVRPDSGDPAHFDYDQNHEGYSGLRADEIRDRLPILLKSMPIPHFVLLHLGTNDLAQNWQDPTQNPASTALEISQIIDRLRARNPKVTIMLAQVHPTSWVSDAMIRELNTRLATLARNKTTTASRIIVVDQYTGVDVKATTFNGLHLNTVGEIEMAKRWYAALKGVLA